MIHSNNLRPTYPTLVIHGTDNSIGFGYRKNNNGDYKTDWDVQSCDSFTNEFGKWSKCNPGMELPV